MNASSDGTLNIVELYKKNNQVPNLSDYSKLRNSIGKSKENSRLYFKLVFRLCIILKARKRQKDLESLKSIWENQIYDKGWNPDLEDFNYFLRHLSNYNRKSQGLEIGKLLFESLKIRGIKPNDYTFICLIQLINKHSKQRGTEIENLEKTVRIYTDYK